VGRDQASKGRAPQAKIARAAPDPSIAAIWMADATEGRAEAIFGPPRARQAHRMTTTLSPAQKQLVDDKNFAHVATVNPDGSVQVTPVWVELDGAHIVFNSEKKRAKVRNLERDPRVTVCVSDSQNPYRYVEVRGRVVEITEVGASEGIDRLAQKYMGKEKYPFHKPGDVRVVLRIKPERVSSMGV
jgi:PPOX class probable F420-dependent enzyme